MKNPIVLLTDFGDSDPFVGIMKGVIFGKAPESVVIDLTHAIAPQDVSEAALVLKTSVQYFPDETLFVAVVDPEVGSKRRIIYLETDRHCFLVPDNGLLTLVVKQWPPIKIIEVSNESLFLHPVSQTFHGRDIFASVAGHLASGVKPELLGAPVLPETLSRLHFPEPSQDQNGIWHGEVVYVDRFGNLVTNLWQPAVRLDPKTKVEMSVGNKKVRGLAQNYEEGNGTPMVLVNSFDTLEIAVKNGNAAARFDVKKGEKVTLKCLTSCS